MRIFGTQNVIVAHENDTTFTHNTATKNGGTLYLFTPGTNNKVETVLDNTTYSNNTAGEYGGEYVAVV